MNPSVKNRRFRSLERAISAALLIFVLGAAATPAPAPAAGEAPAIRLVLFIVVDQLRPDVLARLHPHFGASGFRRVMDGGSWFEDARCLHFPTLTAVGHAALFTGAAVSDHGIAGNDWADPATGARVYCLEDARYARLGGISKPHEGTSPRNLTASTIADEMAASTGGRSRAFAVSLKDRAAILGAGRSGKAFWFANDSGAFVTSTFYYRDLPAWLSRWNAGRLADRYRGAVWGLSPALGPASPAADDRLGERPPKGLGRVFPHVLPGAGSSEFYETLASTPFGDELTVDCALSLLEAEGLGRGPEPDFLALGLACTDYIGHAYGPTSLEYQDQVLRTDALLARLFAAVDRAAGRDRILIVLASDHGVDEVPEIRVAGGYEAARLDGEALRARLNSGLRRRFGLAVDLLDAFRTPGFHVDGGAAVKAGLTLAQVEEAAAEMLKSEPGVAWALTRTDLLQGQAAGVPALDAVRRSVHPFRSPNVILVQKPHWYFYDDPEKYGATHGSPYAYDARVTLGFAGPGIPARRRIDAASSQDAAPTLAVLLGIAPPTGSVGRPLLEPPARFAAPVGWR